MNKKEQQFISQYVNPWLRLCDFDNVVVEAKEVKLTFGNNDFEPQQLDRLRQKTLVFKPVDITSSLPDCYKITAEKKFIAVMFREQGWCIIDILTWDIYVKDNMRIDFEIAKNISDFWFK